MTAPPLALWWIRAALYFGNESNRNDLFWSTLFLTPCVATVEQDRLALFLAGGECLRWPQLAKIDGRLFTWEPIVVVETIHMARAVQ